MLTIIKAAVPKPIKSGYRRVLAWSQSRKVPVDLLLLGGEQGIPADEYATATGNFLRPSTPARQSPHLSFLYEFSQRGYDLLSDGPFQETAYYKNAADCIKLTGYYFEATSAPDIRTIARRFVEREVFGNKAGQRTTDAYGQLGYPISIAPIADSNYYTIIEGNHRIAGAIFRGSNAVIARISANHVSTPAQKLLLSVDWQKNRRELYQPVDLPEVKTWTLVRRCNDRFELINDWLKKSELSLNSYLDLGCSYGWFVREFQRHGFCAHGVDVDSNTLKVGQQIFGVAPEQLRCADISAFLDTTSEKYDFVSMFSVLHHFVLGRGQCTAEELIRKVDNITTHVLFLDTGEAHEKWFKGSLPQWDPDFIPMWICNHSTFKRVVKLGVDSDNVSPFKKNYRRTLFACLRS
jgi:SAM-dependent methyltransferase